MIFDGLRTWSERRAVLRDLAALRRVEEDRDAMRLAILIERAEAAIAADQYNAATKIWYEVRERFYIKAIESQRLFKVLLGLKLFDDAAQFMADGIRRHPQEQFYIVGQATVAQLRGDIPLALERWAIVHRKFPELALGYAHAAACLVSSNRIDEAEKMLTVGIKKSYADVFCLIEHARIAETRGNFEEALLRWQHLRDVQENPRHPCYQNGTLGLARCLRTIGRLNEAEALLQPFLERFGVEEVTLMELARIAEDRQDWEEAIRRWKQVNRSYPLMMEGYLSLISVLRKREDVTGIENVLFEVMDRFPAELWAARDYAAIAEDRHDNAEAARRWLMVIECFPDCELAYHHGVAALTATGKEDKAMALRAACAQRFKDSEFH